MKSDVGEVKRKKPPLLTQPKGTLPYVVSFALTQYDFLAKRCNYIASSAIAIICCL